MTEKDAEAVFADVALLKHLEEPERRRVLAAGSEVRVDKGQILFHEGDSAVAMYVLIEGRIKLVRFSEKGRELLVHLVRPGQSFAEAALFGSGTYPATAEAVEPARCWRLPRKAILGLVTNDPEVGLSMLASMSMWTRRVVAQLQLLTQRRVEERLAVFVFGRTDGSPPERGDRIPLGAPKHLVAAQCGTAPEVLSRTFKKLEEAGILEVDGNDVIVRDPDRFRALAEWIDEG